MSIRADRLRERRDRLERVAGLSPESRDQILVLTVLDVESSLDSGSVRPRAARQGSTFEGEVGVPSPPRNPPKVGERRRWGAPMEQGVRAKPKRASDPVSRASITGNSIAVALPSARGGIKFSFSNCLDRRSLASTSTHRGTTKRRFDPVEN